MNHLVFITTTTLLFLCIQSKAQVVSGIVTDESGLPIEGVKIRIKDTRTFFYSDTKGNFDFKLKNESEDLFFYHLSYYTQRISINRKSAVNDTIRTTVVMKLNENLLDSVVVNTSKIQPVYNRKNISILDYAFTESNLLILFKEKNHYKIGLTTVRGKTLQELILKVKPLAFFADCMGNSHILTKDSCFQIIPTIRQLQLKGHSKNDFQDFLEPCVASTPSHLYFQTFTDYNQGVFYYSIHKTSHDKIVLHQIKDMLATYMAKDYEDSIAENMAPAMIHTNLTLLGDSKDKLEDQFWFQTKLTAPSYNPLIQINDTLYIFDHVSNTGFVYAGPEQLIRTFTIDYNQQKGWLEQLHADEERNQIYAVHNSKGIAVLSQINLTTGKIDNTNFIEEHAFPTKIRIKDGYAYYLFNPMDSFYKLYRQRL